MPCHVIIGVDDNNHFLQKIDEIFSFVLLLSISFLSLNLVYNKFKFKGHKPRTWHVQCDVEGPHDMSM